MSITPDDVVLTIGGQEVSGWVDLSIERSIDAYSTVSVTAPFDADRSDLRSLFRPFEYSDLILSISGEKIFTGIMVDVVPSGTVQGATISITGYSLPAQLQDCHPPQKSLPLKFDDVKIQSVLTAILQPFGLGFEIRGDVHGDVEEFEIDVDSKLQDSVEKLAKQKNLVVTDTPEGKLLLWRSIAMGSPIVTFSESIPPIAEVSAKFTSRECYSEVTGHTESRRGRKGKHWTQNNPWLRRLRPYAFQVSEADYHDVETATKAKLGRMFGNMVAWTLPEIPTWRDPSGALWKPNTSILLYAPHAMIYRQTELLIRAVHLTATAEKQSATLEVVLPGAFSGESPEVLPWAE